MSTLSLLRHAKAAHPTAHQNDFDRPLSARGRADAALIGERMTGLKIDLAVVSTARRTRETWDLARQSLQPAPDLALEPGLYLSSAGSLIARLREISDRFRHVLVIGHNPGLHEIAFWLASSGASTLARSEMQRKFPTAALAVFQLGETPWSALAPETARLDLFATPVVCIAGE